MKTFIYIIREASENSQFLIGAYTDFNGVAEALKKYFLLPRSERTDIALEIYEANSNNNEMTIYIDNKSQIPKSDPIIEMIN